MDNGERIRNARRAQGLSQVALAEKVGCSRLSVINWEQEVNEPLPIYREKLEAVLDIVLREESDARTKQDPPGGGSAR